jgi:competence protein ComEA
MKRLFATIIGAFVVAAILATPASGKEDKARDSKPSKISVIDINRAGAADFEKLPGIGPELAHRIVTYRKKHGPFRRIEDLLAIRGIGEKKWRAIRPYVRVDGKGDDGRPEQ